MQDKIDQKNTQSVRGSKKITNQDTKHHLADIKNGGSQLTFNNLQRLDDNQDFDFSQLLIDLNLPEDLI